MIHTPCTNKDFRVCFKIGSKAHKGQLYNGKPYFRTHVIPIAHYFAKRHQWDEACLALLHDVVEDHGDVYTYDRLCLMGVPSHILKALRCITKREDETYADFIDRTISNDIAWRVKIRDVLQNLSHDPSRYRVRKYSRALMQLTTNCPDSILK